jgi:hypothetical protein
MLSFTLLLITLVVGCVIDDCENCKTESVVCTIAVVASMGRDAEEQ